MTSTERSRRAVRELLLTVGAVVGGICLLAAICSLGFGLKPLIFRSGSMSPAIGTGALAIARTVPASSVAVGDVVSVSDDAGVRITHRVVDVDAGPISTLVLKGDANSYVDPSAYRVTSVDRVLVHVEQLGYVVSWLRHPVVIFLGGLLVGVLITLAFGPRQHGPPSERTDLRADDPPRTTVTTTPDPRSPRRSFPPGATFSRLAAVGAILALVGIGAVPRTGAAFVDQASATTGAFTTQTTLAAPTLNCGLLGLLSVQFTWTAVTGATGYDLILVTASGTSVLPQAAGTTTATITGLLGNGGTAVIRAKIAYPSTTWYSASSNARTYTFLAVSLCA